MIDDPIIIVLLGWVGVTNVALLVARATAGIEIRNIRKKLDEFYGEFDSLHPRQGNPGERRGVRHGHD